MCHPAARSTSHLFGFAPLSASFSTAQVDWSSHMRLSADRLHVDDSDGIPRRRLGQPRGARARPLRARFVRGSRAPCEIPAASFPLSLLHKSNRAGIPSRRGPRRTTKTERAPTCQRSSPTRYRRAPWQRPRKGIPLQEVPEFCPLRSTGADRKQSAPGDPSGQRDSSD